MTLRELSNKATDVFLISMCGSASIACICGAAAVYYTFNYIRGYGL